MKKEIREVLKTKTPSQWLRNIKSKVGNSGLQLWVASIALWNYPDRKAWGSPLDEFTKGYRADRNEQTSKELSTAFSLLGWPYKKGASDDAMPSGLKNAIIADDLIPLSPDELRGNNNARKCIRFHREESANVG